MPVVPDGEQLSDLQIKHQNKPKHPNVPGEPTTNVPQQFLKSQELPVGPDGTPLTKNQNDGS